MALHVDSNDTTTGAPSGPLSGLRRHLVKHIPGARSRIKPENGSAPVASATVALADNVSNAVPLKPASDVVAGAVARAASQSTIHPIDTFKVRRQAGRKPPPLSQAPASKTPLQKFTSLYKGVGGAACGAGIALGAYFAFYGATCNLLSKKTQLPPGAIAFLGGGAAAAGSSIVKVPIAVCIRSVQAGVYKNAFSAAASIVKAAGPRGLFTGYFPTLLEDVPDMAFKFAAYESLRQCYGCMTGGRRPSMFEDFVMGASAGAFAAAATTPLDVIKTNMMCTAASRPTMMSATQAVYRSAGLMGFVAGIGPRAISNGINSAVFFCFFEALRSKIAEQHPMAAQAAEMAKVPPKPTGATERVEGQKLESRPLRDLQHE